MSKVSVLKAQHDQLLGELTSYLDDPEADLAVAEEKETAYKTVKAELDNAVAVADRISVYSAEHKSRSEAKPFLFNVQGGTLKSEKYVGQRIVESSAFKAFSGSRTPGGIELDNEYFKTTLSSSGLTGYERPPGIVTVGVQRPVVADLIPQAVTTQPTVRLFVESSFTNYQASPIAEGGTKPEATVSLTETDFPVRKIAVTVPVTEEMMTDHPAVASYLDNRLGYSVMIQEENQLVNGDGTGSNLTGFLNTSGILSQSKSSDDYATAFHKAITQIRATGFDEPDSIIIHPNDWQKLKLQVDSNGQFLGGGPFTGSYGVGDIASMMPRYWGLKVVPTVSIAAGTALVGAFQAQSQIFRRMGLRIDMTNADGTNFQKNILTIRAEERLALVVLRAKSFCKVTGL